MSGSYGVTAALFAGQGSHHEGMHEPFADHPLLARGIELLEFDPFAILGDGTRAQQPALFLCSMAHWASREADDAAPVAMAGHSLGEYAALTAAGAMSFDDGVRLVKARAKAMSDAAAMQPGGMVAMLGGERDDVFELADKLELSVANDNAPGQIVLSGRMYSVDAAVTRAGDIGCRARKLDVAGAFHSPLMEPAAEALKAALDDTPLDAPTFTVYSNGSAQPFEDIRTELAENLLKPVRWREILLALDEVGVSEYVEYGPGNVLRGLVKRTLRTAVPSVSGVDRAR